MNNSTVKNKTEHTAWYALFYGGGQEIPQFVVPKITSSLFTSRNFDHCTIIALPVSATGGGRAQCPHLRCSSSNQTYQTKKKSTNHKG